MQNYSTARLVLNTVGAIGLLAILFALCAFAFMLSQGILAALTISVPAALVGLVLIAIAELGSAQLDTAKNTAEIAHILRSQASQQR